MTNSPAVKVVRGDYSASDDGVFTPSEAVRDLSIVMALTGPAGSGKTYTALRLATLLAPEGRIAFIDTENRSALLYRKQFSFFHKGLVAPFRPSNFVKLIDAARKDAYDVLIVDGLTPAWRGPGGVLAIADGDFRGWKVASPEHDKLIAAIVGCRSSQTHIICTIRSKVDYAVQTSKVTGKLEITKLGLQPQQRDDLDYEFDLVLDLDVENTARVTKTRYGGYLPMGATFNKPGEDLANGILAAINSVKGNENDGAA